MLRITTTSVYFAAAALLVTAGTARADLDTFESFTPNQSVNGQGEWTVVDSYGNAAEVFDEEIVDDGTGNQVWRLSNETAATSYSNQPFSSKPDQIAGETGAQLYNDYGTLASPNPTPLSSGPATSSTFYGAYDFKSATGAAQGTVANELTVRTGAAASQSTNQVTYLRIADDGNGFYLRFGDTYNGENWLYTDIATGLSYNEWHRVEMTIQFVDGVVDSVGDPYIDGVSVGGAYGNDIVKIYLDGNLIHTGTTWESYYYATTEGGYTPPTTMAVDSLMFRMSGPANLANAGNGIFFDNVETSNIIPEPASLGLIALGGALLLKRRKH